MPPKNTKKAKAWDPEPDGSDYEAFAAWGEKYFGKDWAKKRQQMLDNADLAKDRHEDKAYIKSQKALRKIEEKAEADNHPLPGKDWDQLFAWARLRYGDEYVDMGDEQRAIEVQIRKMDKMAKDKASKADFERERKVLNKLAAIDPKDQKEDKWLTTEEYLGLDTQQRKDNKSTHKLAMDRINVLRTARRPIENEVDEGYISPFSTAAHTALIEHDEELGCGETPFHIGWASIEWQTVHGSGHWAWVDEEEYTKHRKATRMINRDLFEDKQVWEQQNPGKEFDGADFTPTRWDELHLHPDDRGSDKPSSSKKKGKGKGKAQDDSTPAKGKGKGKGKAQDDSTPAKGKGKGKAPDNSTPAKGKKRKSQDESGSSKRTPASKKRRPQNSPSPATPYTGPEDPANRRGNDEDGDDDEDDNAPGPVKRGPAGKGRKARGGERRPRNSPPPPTPYTGPEDPANRRGNDEDDNEDDDDDAPAPVKRGAAGKKRKAREEDEDEDDGAPGPSKRGPASKKRKTRDEDDEDEDDGAPGPSKRGPASKKRKTQGKAAPKKPKKPKKEHKTPEKKSRRLAGKKPENDGMPM